jgi:hypothetical protein
MSVAEAVAAEAGRQVVKAREGLEDAQKLAQELQQALAQVRPKQPL